MMTTRYYCPFDDGWFLDVGDNDYVFDMVRSFVSPEYMLKMLRDKVEHNLKEHLDERHPGWTMEQLLEMQESAK